jgi:hypothetical protein
MIAWRRLGRNRKTPSWKHEGGTGHSGNITGAIFVGVVMVKRVPATRALPWAKFFYDGP